MKTKGRWESQRSSFLDAGLGVSVAAFELRHNLRDKAEIMAVSDNDHFSFVPSNPWVAIRRRAPEQVQAHLPPISKTA